MSLNQEEIELEWQDEEFSELQFYRNTVRQQNILVLAN